MNKKTAIVLFKEKTIRRRDPELNKGWGQIAAPLLIETSGGDQKINCA